MNTILTDDERRQLIDYGSTLDGIARAIEAAVLAKLREQVPVAALCREDGVVGLMPAVGTVEAMRVLDALPNGTPFYAAPQPAVVQVPQGFTDWLCREMPPGTIISDPAWWAPKIARAMLAAAPEAPAQPMTLANAAKHFPSGPFGQPVLGAPEAPALPADVRQALKEAREALGASDALITDLIRDEFAGRGIHGEVIGEYVAKAREMAKLDSPHGKVIAALAQLDALGGVE